MISSLREPEKTRAVSADDFFMYFGGNRRVSKWRGERTWAGDWEIGCNSAIGRYKSHSRHLIQLEFSEN